MSTALTTTPTQVNSELMVQTGRFEAMAKTRNEIIKFITTQLKPDTDFGTIKGCGDRKVLFQPGMQKIFGLLNVFPDNDVDIKELGNGHREYIVKTRLKHYRPDGSEMVVAVGMGSCTTLESKYRYRNTKPTCPTCGHEGIYKTKQNKYWCPRDNGGCNANFPLDDERIQSGGKVENQDLADQYNTVLKMAVKRSNMAALANVAGGIHDQFDANVADFDTPADASPPNDGLPQEEIKRIYETWTKPQKEYYQKQLSGYAEENWDEHYARNAAYNDTLDFISGKAR